MYVKLIHLALAFLPAFTIAQCPEFQITELHDLQRAAVDQKDYTITTLGFDLRSSFTQRGESIRSYSKCWNSNFQGKSVFEQLVWWNQTANSITFMTLNETHYTALRKRILSRHSGKPASENPDFYLGKVFQYRFGGRRVDEVDYFFVQITFR
ncbi:MAG: hypothetical protein H6574_05060 [Lewinellaceae bacterium]|nr:hypothetical protein [Saprospiraceae bacterium]MCB9330433.1 hypothetical protein [Lewinellaceae bacterium]